MPEAVTVERHAGNPRAHVRKFLQLTHDVRNILGRRASFPQVRDVEDEQLRAIEMGERLEPLHERVAARVVAYKEVRLRQLAERAHPIREHEADVVLHVAAYVARVSEVGWGGGGGGGGGGGVWGGGRGGGG